MHLESQIAEYFHGQCLRFLKPLCLKQTIKAQGQKPDSQRLVREGLLGPENRVLCGALWGSVELRGSHSPACLL